MLGDAGKVDVIKDWSGSLVASTTALVGERERRHESLPALIAKEIVIHIRYSVCVRDVSLYTDECHPTLMSVCPRAPNTPPQWLDTEQTEGALPRDHTPMRLHWCKSKQSMKVMTL